MKIVLAYSGGLDTSIILKMMQEKMNAEVITVTVDVGQKDNFEKIDTVRITGASPLEATQSHHQADNQTENET
uniref:argininosuccinate synthase domain-containing protein n=1 Tax=Thermococcus sp. PK TaxID=913025 RepID=UPI000A07876B